MSDSSRLPTEPGSTTAEKLRGTDIDLPDAPDFVSRPRKISLAMAVALNEPLLPLVNSRPGELERRRRNAVTAPFEL
jgi:hypothetical protein